MAHIALIDDDPTEAMVLEGMLSHCDGQNLLSAFARVEDFPAAPDNAAFDIVLLDRRIPPHADFATSLSVLEDSGYAGPIIPFSAGYLEPVHSDRLTVLTPVEKSKLLTPDAVAALIERVLGRA